ncbi:hypothetical protein C1872_02915 [Eggerthella lenta]|uniref:Uncharacterized protein n=1 Tax=Eggerthella lenta TaxID=84112 RepID=A0A369MXD6_EGGLN|nr:hypothetical protein C1872_02915 [Eggerthella lenta]
MLYSIRKISMTKKPILKMGKIFFDFNAYRIRMLCNIHVGIIKTATNEPLIEMVRYLGRRGEYPRRTRKASCRTRSRFSRGSAG